MAHSDIYMKDLKKVILRGDYMAVKYALSVLREEFEELTNEYTILVRTDKEKSARRITQLKHQLGELEFAIEVLEGYED